MVKTWADVEKVFRDAGINYQQKEWFYLCHIEEREFYYSPQTGKWRLKGQRAWQLSQTTIEFITQAKEYSPPGQNWDARQYQQQKTEKKRKKQKARKKQQNTRSANSSSRQRKTTSIDEIRLQFLEEFGHCLQQQRERGYKIGWIWHSLIKQFVPTPLEICWLCVVFNYSPGWAYYQIRDIYLEVDAKQTFKTIEDNRDEWLRYFYARWGEDQQRQQKQHKRKQRTRTTSSTSRHGFIHQNYLRLLELSFPFTKQELKSAYRKKALMTHPDSGGTAEAFREVNTAYQVLSQIH